MASGGSFFDEEDSEWNSSNIKGFSFGDDDKTPWEELAKHQSISDSIVTDQADEITARKNRQEIFFDSSATKSSSASSTVLSDRVKAAARLFSAQLAAADGGFPIVGEGSSSSKIPTELQVPVDAKELRKELISARKQLEKFELTRFTPLHPKETVRRILLGQKYSLEFYKSFKDKEALLDEALYINDGGAILKTALFAKRTLSRQKFLELVVTRPAAVEHLTNYYRTRIECGHRHFDTALNDLLTSLGKLDDVATIQYERACAIPDPEVRVKKIKYVLQNYFQGHPHAHILIGHINLLERVIPVAEVDKKSPEAAGEDNPFPVDKYLLPEDNSESVIKTLIYFSYHHYGQAENLLHSPQALRKMHKLSDRQFVWAALVARARRFNWKECEELVLVKSWGPFSGKKTSRVDPSGVVRILHGAHAPADVLRGFLQLVDDPDDREQLARSVEHAEVVVECLTAKRDRAALEKYASRLKPNSQDWYLAKHVLDTSNTKWKN